MGAAYTSKFSIRDFVTFGEDKSIVARVTGVRFYGGDSPDIQVTWIHDGTVHEIYVQEWLLSEALRAAQ